MQAAKEYIDRRGSLVLSEWRKAVGVIEVWTESKSGRPLLVETITPAMIRAKRDGANKAFAIPAN